MHVGFCSLGGVFPGRYGGRRAVNVSEFIEWPVSADVDALPPNELLYNRQTYSLTRSW